MLKQLKEKKFQKHLDILIRNKMKIYLQYKNYFI